VGDYSSLIDLKFSIVGDLVVDDSGDLDINIGNDCLMDDANIRLNTNAPDWQLETWLGATLSDLIGEPNTVETGKLGREKIMDALTRDGKVNLGDLTVYVLPMSPHQIMYSVVIQTVTGDITLPYMVMLDAYQ